jgi:hypothetical protein
MDGWPSGDTDRGRREPTVQVIEDQMKKIKTSALITYFAMKNASGEK